MGRCSALRCLSNSRNSKQFRFPRDPERRKKWIEACRRDFTPTNSSFLCAKHFAYEAFENRRADGLRKLKPNAIPTIFDFPEPVSQIKNERLKNFNRILQQFDGHSILEERLKNPKEIVNDDYFRNSSQQYASSHGDESRSEKVISLDGDEEIENLRFVENDKFDDTLCHICGSQQSELMTIFEDDGIELDLPAKIRKHFFTIDISCWTKSAKICYQCISVLNSWHELFTLCENTNLDSPRSPIASTTASTTIVDSVESADMNSREPDGHSDVEAVVDPEKESTNRSLLDFIRVVPTDENDDVVETLSSDGDSSLCGNAPSITAENPANFNYNWSPPYMIGATKSDQATKTIPSRPNEPAKKRKKNGMNPNMLPPICHICHKTFSCTLAKRMHLRSVHTEDRPFLCHLCEQTYKRRDHLNAHIRQVHEKQGKRVKYYRSILCPDCGKILSNNKTYEAHAESIHNRRIREYKCNLCDRQFGSYVSCYNHRMKHHKLGVAPTEHKKFSKSCEYCCLNFENEYYYVKHMCQHEEILDCEMCKTTYATHEEYNKHVEEVHIGEKTLECATCGKKFASKMNLKNHIKTHMNEKRFECRFCSWKFLKRGQLKVHEYRHTGEHPYTCEFCKRGFRQKSDFKRHVAAHLQKVKKAAEVPSSHIIEECVEVTAE